MLLLAALFVTWGGKAPASTTSYDPDNPTYNGSQALARVLASHGIPVTVAHGESELGRAPIDADTTVLVTASAELREATITSMARTTHLAGRLVLFVSPERRVVRQLAPNVAMRDVAHLSDALVSDCNTPFVHPGERLSRSQSEYQHPSNTGGCFVNDGYPFAPDPARRVWRGAARPRRQQRPRRQRSDRAGGQRRGDDPHARAGFPARLVHA